jgi:hypothetical protein
MAKSSDVMFYSNHQQTYASIVHSVLSYAPEDISSVESLALRSLRLS